MGDDAVIIIAPKRSLESFSKHSVKTVTDILARTSVYTPNRPLQNPFVTPITTNQATHTIIPRQCPCLASHVRHIPSTPAQQPLLHSAYRPQPPISRLHQRQSIPDPLDTDSAPSKHETLQKSSMHAPQRTAMLSKG